MVARLTPAEAKALGLPVAKGARARPRPSRRTAPGPWHSRCVTCDAEFTSERDEERHLHEHHHARYEAIL